MQRHGEGVLAAALGKVCSIYADRLTPFFAEATTLEELYCMWRAGKVSSSLGEKLDRAWQSQVLCEISDSITRLNIHMIVKGDAAYPPQLAQLTDAPYVLFVHGSLACLRTHVPVACVGTRSITEYGLRVVRRLIGECQGAPLCFVSGLALGIDAAVHRAALDTGLPTLAVIGGGLDAYEPLTNARLGKEIAAQYAVISEYPPGVRPQKHHFLARNRIIAGLAQGVIIIEGKEHSGSLVTARLALGYGREVGVVPGDIFRATSIAPLRLLRDGAWPICSASDVFAMAGITHEVGAKTATDSVVYAALQREPANLDRLVLLTQLDISQLQTELTELELLGKVAMNAQGNYYVC